MALVGYNKRILDLTVGAPGSTMPGFYEILAFTKR